MAARRVVISIPVADRYQSFAESTPGRFVTKRLGMPQPAELRRYEPGAPLLPGHLAWDRIGVGYTRETWLCWSVELWSPVVVKVVRPGWSEPRSTRALHREAWALRDLRHPTFPRLLVDGTAAPVPHLVLEYLDGPALDEVVDDDGLLVGVVRPQDVLRYLAEAFPEELLNLPPRPHQQMEQPEGG
jgi:hypothetical protein